MAQDEQLDALKEQIVQDMKDRGSYNPVDDHLIEIYIRQKSILDELYREVEENGALLDDVTNPAVVRIPSALAALQAQAKLLGIGVYGRKLTTGATEKKKSTTPTVVSQLRPIERKRPKAK
jgi:hypothetical protein